MYETVFENECTTIEEEKCEIQYMTQYEEECSTINEQVKIFIVYTNTRLQILQYYCNYSIIFKISAILLQFDQNFVLGNYQINSMIITCIYLLRFVIQLTKDNAPQSMKKYVKHNINRNILNSVPQHMKKNVQLLMNR